jgi:hypothetical protein
MLAILEQHEDEEELRELVREFVKKYPWESFLRSTVGWIYERYQSLSDELVGQRANLFHLDPYAEIELENDVVPIEIKR